MASLAIVKGTEKDIKAITELFSKCRNKMIDEKIMQWDNGYPTEEHVVKDISDGQLFCIRDGENYVGTITIDGNQPEQYTDIKWSIPANKALVIHRLAVSPDYQGKGIAKYLCRFAENYGKAHSYDVIRLDCFKENPVSNHLYHLLGYDKADGICYFRNNKIPFVCYEKQLES